MHITSNICARQILELRLSADNRPGKILISFLTKHVCLVHGTPIFESQYRTRITDEHSFWCLHDDSELDEMEFRH